MMATGVYGDIIAAPVAFGGPGNSLTANGSLSGSLSIQGSGGVYTWDDANGVFAGETFTIAPQIMPFGSDPDTVALASSPVGSITVSIDDGTYMIDSFFDVSIDLTGGGGGGGALAFAMDPMSLTVDLDAGGTTSIDLTGEGAFSPLSMIDAAGTVTAGVMADVSASAGPIPLGYLFNVSVEETAANNPIVLGAVDPGVGAWYEFGLEASVALENITVNISEVGLLEMSTFSGSQYPYYALTLNYDASGTATLTDITGTLSGVGEIPEPTTLALLVLPAALLRLRGRR